MLPGAEATRPRPDDLELARGAPHHAADILAPDVTLMRHILERSDLLLSALGAMARARVDLASPGDVARVLDAIEQKLSSVRARLDAVEARLAEVRAVIVRRYREGMLPSLDQSARTGTGSAGRPL